MKKLSFTKLESKNLLSFLGRSSFLILFALCFSMTANAQVEIPADSSWTVVPDLTCDESPGVHFVDDGGLEKLYADNTNGGERADTITFCPKDEWHRVTVTFTAFDLEEGDTLYAFDGNKAEVEANLALLAAGTARGDTLNRARLVGIGSGSGVGASKAFGSWISAHCDPWVNPSGCLTFVIKTDDDDKKGAGWDAWVTCSERGLAITAPANVWETAACEGASGDAPTASVAIKAATITGDCELLVPWSVGANPMPQPTDLRVDVTGPSGLCISDTVAANTTLPAADLPVGRYTVVHTLLSDPVKTATSYINVAAPSLVGNDEVNATIGNGCKLVLDLDALLEGQVCEINNGVSYKISIGGTDVVGTDGTVTVDTDKIPNKCGGQLTATITRTFDYSNNGLTAVCTPSPIVQSVDVLVNVSDNVKPFFTRATTKIDTIIACDAADVETYLVKPDAVDNCGTPTVTSEVTPVATTECGNPKDFLVVWTAEDACGNKSATLTDTVRILRPTTFVQAPDVEKDCGLRDAGVDPILANEDYRPGLLVGRYVNGAITADTKDTVRLSETTYICNYILVRNAPEEVPADCGKKVFVDWDYVDWCTGNLVDTLGTQFIHFTDSIAPVINTAGIVSYDVAKENPISLDHFECHLTKNPLPSVTATDNCDDAPAVGMIAVEQKGAGDTWGKIADNMSEAIAEKSITCDTFRVVYEASDACHTQTKVDRDTSYFIVIDDTKPSAACVDALNVSVPNEWGARVYVTDIDAGSFDACEIASMLIRIKGSDDDFAEYVTIGCEYVHPDVQIEMQVTDGKGNTNLCWLDIVVEDKINPICNPLEDKTADCEKYHAEELGASTDTDENLEMDDTEFVALTGDLLAFYNTEFGDPTKDAVCEDNLAGPTCGELTYEQEYQLVKWPCGEAKITRRYRAIDWSENKSAWVSQTITITSTQNWTVEFAGDWEGTCGAIAPADQITITNGACDLLGYEVTADTFNIPGDACFKIVRTYHVINWCNYVAGDEPVELDRVEGDHGISEGLTISSDDYTTEGYWTYVQVLKIHDNEAPVVTITNPDGCINAVEFDALPYGEEDNSPGVAPFECDEEKTWSAVATDCSSNISWEAKLYNASTGELVKEAKANEITHVVSNKESYFVEFWAYDNCGNSGGEKGDPIKFWDCKKPTPYVLNGIAVELGESASVQVWATDLDQASFDNCSDQDKLQYRIWADFLGDAPTDFAGVDALGQVITFDCDRVGNNLVHIYVIDEENNWDYAQTYVIVQDNMLACGNTEGGMVAGRILNPQGENVEAVTVTVAGSTESTMVTGTDGQFQFNMDMGADYTVTPVKDINPLNGVSTFDLVLISKHILGITQFDAPYKYIAADVNKSGTITAFDMVQLRQLILNIRSEFPSNDSWRFVDASHDFASANPASEDFSEFYTINTLSEDMMNLDFVGVKVGDVNGNAQANSLLGAESRTTNGALTLTAADRFVEVGETVTVAFTAADIASAQGYQFTMNFAGQNAEVVEGVAKAANFNTTLAERGVIATSWNGEATANDVLFALTFNATASGLISELVSVSSDVTTAEAYNANGELLDVNLAFTTAVAAGFELTQNTPNPFNAETVIGFNLPAAGNATLTVMDAQGKVLKSISADYAKGANTVTLRANELGATGVLYYQLESADNVATKKMIIIE